MKLETTRKFSWILRILILAGVMIIFKVGYFPVGIFEIIIVTLSFLFLLSKRKMAIVSEFLVLLLFFLNIMGILVFYEALFFYDDMLHIFGSVVLAVITYSFLNYKLKNKKAAFILSVLIVIFLGFAWELYEFAWDIFITPNFDIPKAQVSLIDTISDLIWGVLGGIVTLIFLVRRK